ncbi:MAG: S41 family peptidase, partial [bacterium]|nr:S41 family peptidase [bacterium]
MSQNPFFEDVRPVPHLHSPALSPDGGRLFFVYSGDIWSVSAGGGEAYQITSHVGYDRAPRFSPDGRQVVFESNRTGNGDLYVLDLESGDVRRLTHFGGGDALGDWSPDGAWLYFSSRRDGLSGGIFKVPVQGGTPIEVVCDPREAHSQPVLSPDGKTLALVNDGTPLWRKGPHPALASSIWTVSEAAGSTDYRRVTTYAGRNNNPMWAPDGKTIYFISDEGGTENIWAVGDDGSQRRPLTQFEEGRCLRASVSRDGRRIAFDRVGEIWLLDLESGEAGPVEIRVRADQKINPKTHRTFTNGLDEFSLSGDGKKVLFGVHGELFAAPSKGEEVYDAIRVTESSFREFMADWRPDSRAAVYLSDRFGNYELFEYDFVERAERQLTEDPEVQKYLPRYSPDGKWIAYLHGREEIRLIERETGTVRPFIHNALFTGVASSVSFAWAPDSQWIVFVARDQNFFNNLYVQRLDETEARQITFLSQVGTGAPLWSPNGKFIVFTTQQYRTQGQLARVDLTPVLPVFKEDEFEKLFEDEEDELEEGTPGDPEEQEEDEDEPQDAGASEVVNGGEDAEEKGVKQEGESIEIVFEGIKRRLQLLTPLEMNAAALAICPDGKALVFRSAVTGRDNLWHLLLEDAKQSEPPRQLTDTRGEKGRVCFTKDGKKIFYMDGGEIVGRDFPGGKTKKLRVRAELDVDFHVEKRQIFQEAWTLIRDHFYDPNFHGVNWEAVRDRYMPLAAGVQVQDDLLDILNLVVGELNGSHLGAGRSGAGVHDGYLGLTFGRVAQEAGRFEVVGVLPDGPCDVIAQPVVAGEVLTAIDGQMLNGGINFWERLQHKVGKKVRLTLELPGGETREADVRPVGAGAISDLAYRNWVYGNAAYVDRVSGGRLGYVHIRAMGLEDLHQFLIDLDTEAHSREGVLVDVRYNGGGHIATFILDVLAKRDFVRSSYRGKITTSSANLSGDRILNKPTVLLTNEHSGSNAEMFSEGYRRLGLGKVVGTPTMGAVIWTGTWKF